MKVIHKYFKNDELIYEPKIKLKTFCENYKHDARFVTIDSNIFKQIIPGLQSSAECMELVDTFECQQWIEKFWD